MTSYGDFLVSMVEVHDDVIKWKHLPCYWPSERGIDRSPVNSSHKGQWRGALMFSLICAWLNGWVKQSWGWWFETPSCPLWPHCKIYPTTCSVPLLTYYQFGRSFNQIYVKIRSFSLMKLWFQTIHRKMAAIRILYGFWSMFKKWEATTFPNIDAFYLQLTCLLPFLSARNSATDHMGEHR